jgi:ribosomal protein S18 acetylase RimI-like enzyme
MQESSEPNNRPRMRIRQADSDDRDFVRDLATEVFSIYGSYGRYLTDWFDQEGVTTLVGEIEEEPIGIIMLGVRPSHTDPGRGVAELLAIAVTPSRQSQGLGSILMNKAVEEAPRLPSPIPIVEMHLSVAEGNARAQRLFGRRGFRQTGGEGIYPAGQRAIHMVKVL